jgi:predicted nuclease with TOPRIM domain
MIHKTFLLLLAALCLGSLPGASLRAQDPPLTPAQKQELARGKFRDLTTRMQKLMVTLQKTEPDESKLLGAGLQYAQEKKLQQRLDQANAMLQSERWDESLVAMGTLKADLATLLDLLQARDDDLRKLLDQIKRLSGFRERVDQLAKEQQAEKQDSAQALLAQQQELRAATNQLGVQAAAEATKPLADKEAQLQKQTERLQGELEALEQKQAELAPKPAQPVEPAQAQPAAPSPPQASANAGKAAKAMGQAQQQLGEQKPEPSLPEQDQAIAKLQEAVRELDQMADEAKRELAKLPFDQQQKRQEATQAATDKLAQEMEQPAEGEQPSDEAKPGQKRVQQAVPKQRAAAGQLKEQKPAKQKQQDAKDDLDAAKKELDEALAQLRQQLQDEVLRALEDRFTAMQKRQKELSARTVALDGARKNVLTADGQLPASLVEQLQGLAKGEDELAAEAGDALKLLGEDGTTAVFPPLVEQLRDDLAAVAKRLAASQSGPDVQQAQRDVEDLLDLLINALRKTIERKECGH